VRTYATGRDAVLDVCRRVMSDGEPVSPRGQWTRELVGESFRIASPWDSLPTGIGRKGLNPAVGALEALQNISGTSALEVFRRIVPASAKWDDDTPTYGTRLGGQLGQCVERLRDDPESRQAVALIWREWDMTGGQAHNLCTIGLQFLLRDGVVHTFAHMRSNDAWWGLCYDLFQFCQLGASVANALGTVPGDYYHSANSMHLYERHWAVAGQLHDPDPVPHEPLFGVGRRGVDDWRSITGRARSIIDGVLPEDPTHSERWYFETLQPYLEED
jgi:thymidylate synthase